MQEDHTMSSSDALAAQHAPRIGHKKSRNGCLKCRARRVKCDETHPTCRNCVRLGLICRYGSSPSAPHASTNDLNARTSPQTTLSPPTTSGRFYEDAALRPDDDLTESPQRRHMELRLLHFWLSKPFENQGWGKIWGQSVPALALENEHLLYALLALAATQLAPLYPDDDELALAQQTYWNMALREQRLAVARLEETDPQAMSFASVMLATGAFCMLRNRPLEPYTPPLAWLAISQGAMSLGVMGRHEAIDTPLGNMLEILEPLMSADEAQAAASSDPSNSPGDSSGSSSGIGYEYQRLLDPGLSPGELRTVEALRPYEKVLRHISAFRRDIVAGKGFDVLVKRILVFPYVVPDFLGLLREMRPRALVVLAAFFALVAQSSAGYVFGDPENLIARTEVSAILSVVPLEWQPLMVSIVDEAMERVKIGPELKGKNWVRR